MAGDDIDDAADERGPAPPDPGGLDAGDHASSGPDGDAPPDALSAALARPGWRGGRGRPKATALVLLSLLAIVAGGAAAFFGYPAWVGTHLRNASASIGNVVTAASLLAVVGLAVAVAVDAGRLAARGAKVGGAQIWAWALGVAVFALIVFPAYLGYRAKAIRERPPDDASLARSSVFGVVAGLFTVGLAVGVVAVASVAAEPAFGVAVDPARVEQAISRGSPNALGSIADLAGVTNVSCTIPGLLHRGDTFRCTQRPDDTFGIPVTPTMPGLLPTTTARTLVPAIPGAVTPARTITFVVTVTDDEGSVRWERQG